MMDSAPESVIFPTLGAISSPPRSVSSPGSFSRKKVTGYWPPMPAGSGGTPDA
jgi:hypothetical protein